MPSAGDIRPSRSAPSRRCGPDRREPTDRQGPASAAARPCREQDILWELWTLRALFPEATRRDLLDLRARQAALLAREREALAGLWSGERGNLSPGHGFWAANPDLGAGMTVSLHMGPYQLLAEPYLAAGRSPLILLNEDALRSFLPHAEGLSRLLGHRGPLRWASLGDPTFVRRMIGVLREGQPVIVYLDGNTGSGGTPDTRDHGLTYRLPGRDIRVRTGLARLACRLGCPVHRVAVHWGDEGRPVWDRAPTLLWGADDDPDHATRVLFDWCFTQVMKRPEQWHHWAMVRESSACFRAEAGDSAGVPAGLREDFRRAFDTCLQRSPATVRLILENEVAVWPGDVLADLTEDRFYPAAGLLDADLELMRAGQPTLAELVARHGQDWVRCHGLRLCLLGMARLGG